MPSRRQTRHFPEDQHCAGSPQKNLPRNWTGRTTDCTIGIGMVISRYQTEIAIVKFTRFSELRQGAPSGKGGIYVA